MIPTKESIILRDVICKYHPVFKKYPDVCQTLQDNSDVFENATEKLAEKTLGIIGGLTLEENGVRKDYNDRSDAKTGIVFRRSYTANIHPARITGVYHIRNYVIEWEKEGALRLMYANLVRDRLDCLYVPRKDWKQHSYDKHSGHITSTWTEPGDTYSWEKYPGTRRFDNVYDMANYRP